MHLTHYTDYSLRVLMYVTVKPEGELSQIKEISEAYHISKNHLMKVVYQLGKLGYIETLRGRNGGIRLNQAPEDINIGTLVRHTEDNFHIVECFDQENNQCPITPACQLQFVLGDALKAYMNVLDQYTLADITKNKQALAGLLQLQPE
ncbi:Rrf2 family transcriptional regulator [Alkalicoccus urumqiensis]|uniref:HTH-type transcriptional regulator NsrR n=1 Tax=Alkalicoccus urumqiensis TaxID=1548213 RepID=A0A2P6MI92_ALKUR|nr:Rrf2 family transcriptional regulator [Alkalicoccus urumqiensis]PRO66009.1 Rrf2 family transcriptional regulator [Alkalicoccus urumqiensis]